MLTHGISQYYAFSRLPLIQVVSRRLFHFLMQASRLSPTGTYEGDIHMRSDCRVIVDEYAQVVTIPIG